MGTRDRELGWAARLFSFLKSLIHLINSSHPEEIQSPIRCIISLVFHESLRLSVEHLCFSFCVPGP